MSGNIRAMLSNSEMRRIAVLLDRGGETVLRLLEPDGTVELAVEGEEIEDPGRFLAEVLEAARGLALCPASQKD